MKQPLLSAALGAALLLPGINAQADGEVNVYSYRQAFLIDPLFEAFTKDTGVKVNVVFAKDGLIERLKQEGRNSPADILLTADFGRLQDAVEESLTQVVQNAELEANIPAQFRDPEGHWFGLTQRARVIVTAKDRVPDGAVQRYEDLADPQWRGRLCTRSGKHPYMTGLIAAMIVQHGAEDAKQWLAGLKANLARKPQGGDRDQVKAIKEGVCDVAVINSYYLGAMASDPEQASWAGAVTIIFPNQQDRGTHMNISGVALTQSAPNKDAAIQLMTFLSGEHAQKIYAEQNFEYPVKPGVARAPLLQSWGEFKADTLPLADVAKQRKTAILLADEVGYDG